MSETRAAYSARGARYAPQRYPCLGHYPTAAAARAACEADAAEQAAATAKPRGSFCG